MGCTGLDPPLKGGPGRFDVPPGRAALAAGAGAGLVAPGRGGLQKIGPGPGGVRPHYPCQPAPSPLPPFLGKQGRFLFAN